jgi:hypothetical protein
MEREKRKEMKEMDFQDFCTTNACESLRHSINRPNKRKRKEKKRKEKKRKEKKRKEKKRKEKKRKEKKRREGIWASERLLYARITELHLFSANIF